jgi:O-antigen polymerase
MVVMLLKTLLFGLFSFQLLSRILFQDINYDLLFCCYVSILSTCLFINAFRKAAIQFNKIDIVLALVAVLILCNALFYSPYYDQSRLLLVLASALLFLSFRCFSNLGSEQLPGIYTMILLSASLEAGYALLQYLDIIAYHSTYFPMAGSFGNIGHFANYLAVMFPLSLHIVLYPEKYQKEKYLARLAQVATFLIIVAVALSGNKSSWLVCIVMFTVVYLDKINWKTFLLAGTTLAVLLLLFTVTGFKSESAAGRVFIWKVSTSLLTVKPVSGHGFNSFQKVYNDAQGDYFRQHQDPNHPDAQHAGYVEYAYNDIYELIIEYGFIMLLLVGFLIAAILYAAGRFVHVPAAGIAVYCLFAVLLASFFFYPVSILPIRVALLFFLAVMSQNLGQLPQSKPWLVDRRFVLVIFGSLLATCLFLVTRTFYDNAALKKDLSALNTRDHERALSCVLANKSFDATEKLQLAQIEFGKRNFTATRSILANLAGSNADPVLYYRLAETYSALSMADSAVFFYNKAIHQLPNRLYPRYLLMKHFEGVRDRVNALKVAREIMEIRPKVVSIATNQIRDSAEYLLRSAN